MLKYNEILVHDKDEVGETLEKLNKDEILLGKINGKKCMLKLIDDEELAELHNLIDIK